MGVLRAYSYLCNPWLVNVFNFSTDVKGEIVDDAKVVLDSDTDTKFQATLKIENLKVVPDEYVVEISSVGVSKFHNESKNLTYWIAIEAANSTFGEE